MSRRALSGREVLVALAVAFGLAFVLRWPVSLYVESLPLDPNTPLHVLSAQDLAGGGTPGRLESLGYPDGAAVRLLAWPILLLAVPLEAVLPSIAAFNIAVLAWLAFQGVAVYALCRRERWPRAGSALAGVAVSFAPAVVLALGNGQYENVAILPVVLAIAGARRGGVLGWVWCAVGFILAVFSTPYQGVVAGVMALASGAVAGGLRRAGAVLAAGALAGALAYPYFVAERAGDSTTVTGPASASHIEPAVVGYLLRADAHPATVPPDLPDPRRRVLAAAVAPVRRPVGTWIPNTPMAASYVGVASALGVLGLLRGRREPLVAGAGVGGLACLVLAFGAHLAWQPERASWVPLPWALLERLPGLDGMQVTHRFLFGVGLALALGLGRLVASSTFAAVVLAVAVAADGLLVAPAWWPVPAAAPRVAALAAMLPDGPVAVWPGFPAIATDRHAVLALALDRPVASFDGVSEPESAGGTVLPSVPKVNRYGETPDEWLVRAREAGVVAFLALPAGKALRPRFFRLPPADLDGVEMWRLDNPEPAPPPRRPRGAAGGAGSAKPAGD